MAAKFEYIVEAGEWGETEHDLFTFMAGSDYLATLKALKWFGRADHWFHLSRIHPGPTGQSLMIYHFNDTEDPRDFGGRTEHFSERA